jgi:hypothetical protein
MSEYGFEDYMNDDVPTEREENQTMKVLREKAEADSKRIQELSEKLARLEENSRQNSVASVFEAAGVSPKVAKFYKGEADTEKVNQWLAENAEVFGLAANRDDAPIQEVAERQAAPATPQVTFEQQQAYLRMQNAGIDGQPSDNHGEVMGSLNAAQNMDELLAAMQRHGWTGGF